jgi:hypothetical protein
MSAVELVSSLAAVVSAIGGAFAAIAAFRSADSASKAQFSADEAERRAVLRQVVLAGKDIELEAKRCADAAELAGRSHKNLAIFEGGLGGSRHGLVKNALAEKLKRAEAIEGEGRLFGTWPSTLESAPLSDIDRVLTKLLALLSEAKGMRDALERDRADAERQCDVYRTKAIGGGPGNEA